MSRHRVVASAVFPILAFLAVLHGVPAEARAVPITLFSDLETYLDRAKEIIIARCIEVPEGDGLNFIDGLYPATVDVVTNLKGQRELSAIPVVILSAGSDRPANAEYFLKKPIDFDILIDILRSRCAGASETSLTQASQGRSTSHLS